MLSSVVRVLNICCDMPNVTFLFIGQGSSLSRLRLSICTFYHSSIQHQGEEIVECISLHPSYASWRRHGRLYFTFMHLYESHKEHRLLHKHYYTLWVVLATDCFLFKIGTEMLCYPKLLVDTACYCMQLHATACNCVLLHEQHATACYCMLLHATACYCMLLHATACYCMLLHATACYCMLLYATACYCMLLHATACYCMLLHATACYCMLLHATACYCMLLHATACYCMLLYAVTCSPPDLNLSEYTLNVNKSTFMGSRPEHTRNVRMPTRHCFPLLFILYTRPDDGFVNLSETCCLSI